jgi:hypothetical protein
LSKRNVSDLQQQIEVWQLGKRDRKTFENEQNEPKDDALDVCTALKRKRMAPRRLQSADDVSSPVKLLAEKLEENTKKSAFGKDISNKIALTEAMQS